MHVVNNGKMRRRGERQERRQRRREHDKGMLEILTAAERTERRNRINAQRRTNQLSETFAFKRARIDRVVSTGRRRRNHIRAQQDQDSDDERSFLSRLVTEWNFQVFDNIR